MYRQLYSAMSRDILQAFRSTSVGINRESFTNWSCRDMQTFLLLSTLWYSNYSFMDTNSCTLLGADIIGALVVGQ